MIHEGAFRIIYSLIFGLGLLIPAVALFYLIFFRKSSLRVHKL